VKPAARRWGLGSVGRRGLTELAGANAPAVRWITGIKGVSRLIRLKVKTPRRMADLVDRF
jgi:hypothetical protein